MQRRKGADLNRVVVKYHPHREVTTHELDDVAQSAHQNSVPVLDLGDLGLLDVEGLGHRVLGEGKSPAQLR